MLFRSIRKTLSVGGPNQLVHKLDQALLIHGILIQHKADIPLPAQGRKHIQPLSFRLPSKSRHFLPWLAGRWLDIPPPAIFRFEKGPASGCVSPGAGRSIPSAANPAHSRLISFSDTFSRRMRTLSSASTNCRASYSFPGFPIFLRRTACRRTCVSSPLFNFRKSMCSMLSILSLPALFF